MSKQIDKKIDELHLLLKGKVENEEDGIKYHLVCSFLNKYKQIQDIQHQKSRIFLNMQVFAIIEKMFTSAINKTKEAITKMN